MKAPIFTSSFCHWKNNFVFILLECSSKLRNLLALLAGINRAFFVPQGNCSCLLNTDGKQMFCTCYRSAHSYILLQAALLWMNFPGEKPSLSACCLRNTEDARLGSLLKLLQVNYCGLRLSENHRHLMSCAQQLSLQTVLQNMALAYQWHGGRVCPVPLEPYLNLCKWSFYTHITWTAEKNDSILHPQLWLMKIQFSFALWCCPSTLPSPWVVKEDLRIIPKCLASGMSHCFIVAWIHLFLDLK